MCSRPKVLGEVADRYKGGTLAWMAARNLSEEIIGIETEATTVSFVLRKNDLERKESFDRQTQGIVCVGGFYFQER